MIAPGRAGGTSRFRSSLRVPELSAREMRAHFERPELDDVTVGIGDVQRATAVGIVEANDLRLVSV
jgi:hypothetical protein